MHKIFLTTLILIIPLISIAEGPPWRKVSSLGFAGNKAGIIFYEGDEGLDKRGPYHYEISLDGWITKSIPEKEYIKKFGGNALHVSQGHGYDTIKEFITLTGKTFHTEYKDCLSSAEGGDQCALEYLIHKDQRIKLETQDLCPYSCVVTHLQEWDNIVWVALGHQSEYSMYGQGFQAYELTSGKKVFEFGKKSDEKLHVSLIARNPITKKIWIAGEEGIRIISSDLKTIQTFYFYLDFNPESYTADIQLSPTVRSNNTFAEISHRLMLPNQKEIYEATKGIKSNFNISIETYRGYGKGFIPETLNVLVPFLLKEKDKTNVMKLLCFFKDPRVAAKIMNTQLDCREKFVQAGLIPITPGVSYEEGMLIGIRDGIKNFKSIDDQAPTSFNGKGYALVKNTFKLAEDLKLTGSSKGLLEFNNFLLSGEKNSTNIFIGSLLLHHAEKYDELKTGIINVLKTYKSELGNACVYFSPNRGHGESRIGSEYAVLILKAINRLIKNYHDTPMMNEKRFPHNEISSCAHAFIEQLMIEKVKEDFEKLSAGLSQEEKKLSDYLRDGGIPDEKWKK